MSSYVTIIIKNYSKIIQKLFKNRQKILIVVFYVSGITSKEQLQRL